MLHPKPVRIIFIGTGEFAVPNLKAVTQLGTVPLVISQPPRKTKRGVGTSDTPVMQASRSLQLRCKTPEHIIALLDELRHEMPDVMVVADYGQLIPPEVLAIPKFGCLNIHPSLLPKYRGPSPISAVILAAEKETGVTIILMDREMDHGPILEQQSYPLSGSETAPELKQQMAEAGARLLHMALPMYIAGRLQPHEQHHQVATHCLLLRRSDGELRLSDLPAIVERKCRAYQPWPGVWFTVLLRAKMRTIKLLRLHPWPEEGLVNDQAVAGSFFWQNKTLGLVLEHGALVVEHLQVAGGRPLSGGEFYRGYQDTVRNIDAVSES